MQVPVIVSHLRSAIQSPAGGSEVRSMYIFKAIAPHLQNAKYLNLCADKKLHSIYVDETLSQVGVPIKRFNVHSFNFMSRDNVEEVMRVLKTLLRTDHKKVMIICCDPISLSIFLRAKKLLNNYYDIKVLWSSGGNELTCPLHTEVCPFTNSYTNTYGHQVLPSSFFFKCLPHIVKTRRVSMYHIGLWPLLRREIVKNVDGLLATRSVYIEGCKLLGLERCHYIGFGIDTKKFTPRDRVKVVGHLLDDKSIVADKLIWGDFDRFTNELLNGDIIVLSFVGAARPWWKNVELIVVVFNHIAKIFSNVFLLVVGRHMNSLMPLLSRLPRKVREKIVIIDQVPHTHVHLFYNLGDIFINPSLLDSLEINTLEALASGNIVLVSNRGCINDLKYMGIRILKVFEPTPRSLLNTLIPILKNIDSHKDEITKELEYVRQKLSLETYGERIIRALKVYNYRGKYMR